MTTPFGQPRENVKQLRITVPEDLEFEGAFDEVLDTYTANYELSNVQTTNMGSLYQLDYHVTMKGEGLEKRMIDELRCLNGNLKISVGTPRVKGEVL